MSAFHSHKLWNFHKRVSLLKCNWYVGSWNMTDEIFQGKHWAWKVILDSLDTTIKGRNAQGHALVPKYANHIRLANLHVVWAKCPIFLTIYMQRMFIDRKISKSWTKQSNGTKLLVLHGHRKYSTLIKMNIINVHAKFALEWQPLVGIDTTPTKLSLLDE